MRILILILLVSFAMSFSFCVQKNCDAQLTACKEDGSCLTDESECTAGVRSDLTSNISSHLTLHNYEVCLLKSPNKNLLNLSNCWHDNCKNIYPM